jgi:hypothetical protein
MPNPTKQPIKGSEDLEFVAQLIAIQKASLTRAIFDTAAYLINEDIRRKRESLEYQESAKRQRELIEHLNRIHQQQINDN